MSPARPSRQSGFTIVEVMMASVILVVGFIGMIEALAITSTQIDSARRQTLANQILNHELEQLRLESWTTLSNLLTTGTWASGTAYAVGDIVTYQGGSFICTAAHTNNIPGQTNSWAAYMTWNSSTAYKRSNLVSYNNTWYRCIADHSGQTPPNATYWTTYNGPLPTVDTSGDNNAATNFGTTFTLTRTVTDVVAGSLREVTFTVTMTVNSNRAISGTRQTFTYTRVNSAYYGKNGLNLSYQRS